MEGETQYIQSAIVADHEGEKPNTSTKSENEGIVVVILETIDYECIKELQFWVLFSQMISPRLVRRNKKLPCNGTVPLLLQLILSAAFCTPQRIARFMSINQVVHLELTFH